MEIHSVLPEERARDPRGETLPWGYRYADSTRNARQLPEESGPFGRNRSIRSTASRTPRARTGTTPVRQKENTAVAEFGRLFAKEQAKEEERKTALPSPPTASGEAAATERPIQPEAVPTECLLYGYAGKQSEWKVLSKFEKIVSPGIICEDYPREDPNLYLSSNSPLGLSGGSVVVHQNLSREAIRKSRIYCGGNHWIKVTFDSYQAAERACFYSPIDIDGYMVHCEMWHGKGPAADVPLPKGPAIGSPRSDLQQPQPQRQPDDGRRARTLPSSQSSRTLSGKQSAIAGFERALQTLPRSHTMPDMQYGQPLSHEDEQLSIESATASSATATATDLAPPQPSSSNGLRSRSVPQLPSETGHTLESEYMTHIKNVKKVVLRPISEALPPQPTFVERVLRSIPIVSYFMGSTKQGATGRRDVIGEGPLLKDDGSWDPANGWYWSFWHGVDRWFGTDFCGLKDD
ncbi:uncharacterized protein Z519_02126 [Cladophialophora bantiana CBS 173.52]|uniref:Nucleoporin NUP53 n=1 Tax=Cladophialophora bantiana (strain ATCC 10958 / CBS 173.52 / CDC B-1940 / NIH 8579) TaxID=1442370 RepID=A0A0D2I0M6_CLAB1|nr:uncharacterized protein Z519_02126 [Cladophialophora bantiana CBS 173.52]KIW96735.1 hypothetical protein Z519_02126 [Cladophialophora bantiana CBS 173.52]